MFHTSPSPRNTQGNLEIVYDIIVGTLRFFIPDMPQVDKSSVVSSRTHRYIFCGIIFRDSLNAIGRETSIGRISPNLSSLYSKVTFLSLTDSEIEVTDIVEGI